MIPERLFALLDQWISFGVVQRFRSMLKTLAHRQYVLFSEISNWPAENNDKLTVIWITTIVTVLDDGDY